MFLIFLTMFSYVMLCDFYPIKHLNEDGIEIGKEIGIFEKILIIWVCIFLVDTSKQVNVKIQVLLKENFSISNYLYQIKSIKIKYIYKHNTILLTC